MVDHSDKLVPLFTYVIEVINHQPLFFFLMKLMRFKDATCNITEKLDC